MNRPLDQRLIEEVDFSQVSLLPKLGPDFEGFRETYLEQMIPSFMILTKTDGRCLDKLKDFYESVLNGRNRLDGDNLIDSRYYKLFEDLQKENWRSFLSYASSTLNKIGDRFNLRDGLISKGLKIKDQNIYGCSLSDFKSDLDTLQIYTREYRDSLSN